MLKGKRGNNMDDHTLDMAEKGYPIEYKIEGILYVWHHNNGKYLIWVNIPFLNLGWIRLSNMEVGDSLVDMALEHTIEKNILAYLNKIKGVKAAKWPQDGRQKGNPDIICSYYGKMFLFEVKQPGEEQSKLQVETAEEWKRSGVIVNTVTSLGEVKSIIEKHQNCMGYVK